MEVGEASSAPVKGTVRAREAVRRLPPMLRRYSALALDLILPPQCPITGERVASPGQLSVSGWSQLNFIDDPACARCGAPFAHENGEGAECAACIAEPPSFDRARAAVIYDDASHKLIVGFKHSDRTDLIALFAGWLARAGAPFLREGTILVPTPLHARRLLSRRYNQAALLANALGRAKGAPVVNALRRTRQTPPQQSLSAAARQRNVAGAFDIRPETACDIADAHIVLIDDVLTTGATLSACARVLKKGGAASVDALVLARVMRSGEAI